MNDRKFDLDVLATVEISKIAEVLADLPSDDEAEFFNEFFGSLFIACDSSHFKTQTQLLHIWAGLNEETRQKLAFMVESAS